MKRILFFLTVIFFLESCSKENEVIDPNAPTTFLFEHMDEDWAGNVSNHTDYVAGYFDDDGCCWKIADFGTLDKPKQQTKEVAIDGNISEIYLYYCFLGVEYHKLRRSFPVKKGIKNVFKLKDDDLGDKIDRTDPKQYPQEKGSQ